MFFAPCLALVPRARDGMPSFCNKNRKKTYFNCTRVSSPQACVTIVVAQVWPPFCHFSMRYAVLCDRIRSPTAVSRTRILNHTLVLSWRFALQANCQNHTTLDAAKFHKNVLYYA